MKLHIDEGINECINAISGEDRSQAGHCSDCLNVNI